MPSNKKTQLFIDAVERLRRSGEVRFDSEIIEKIGLQKSNFSLIMNGKRGVPEKYYLELIKKFPSLNDDNKVYEPSVKYSNATTVDLGDRVILQVPLVNQYAYAGYLSGFADNEYLETLPTVPFIVEKEPKGKYLAFEIKGDSMNDGSSDSYLQGDILLCREVKRDLWRSKLHIKKWDFVIVHRTKGIVFKKITNHDTVNGHLDLKSLNPEYENFSVKLDDIVQILNVVQVTRKK